MRIVHDAYWWVEGPLSNRSVQRAVIATWAHDYPTDEITMIVPQAHLQAARSDAPEQATLVGTRLRPHALAAAVTTPRIAERVGADAVFTHNFAPWRGRSAVFIHDVLFQSDPGWFTRPERLYFAAIPLLARRAGVVLTSSGSEASRIRTYNRRLRNVVPVGLAVPAALRAASPRRPAGVPDNFLLSVGRLNVRKNLATTIRAGLQSGVVTPERPLVVVGSTDGRDDALAADLASAVADRRIVVLDHVDDAELAWLYSSADLFVFLSLGEGYGLTPVEALTFGCPVLVSDLPVFRETLGAHARFVDPHDAAAAAQAIRELARDRVSVSVDHVPATTTGTWSDCVARIRQAVLEVADGRGVTR